MFAITCLFYLTWIWYLVLALPATSNVFCNTDTKSKTQQHWTVLSNSDVCPSHIPCIRGRFVRMSLIPLQHIPAVVYDQVRVAPPAHTHAALQPVARLQPAVLSVRVVV